MLAYMMRLVVRYLAATTLVAFGLAQLIAAFAGTAHVIKTGWLWAGLVALAALGCAWPLSIGAFIGALREWHWPWALAAVFAAPRLITVIPGYIASALAKIRHG